MRNIVKPGILRLGTKVIRSTMSPRIKKPRRVCALVSGGVESAALMAALLERGDAVFPLYVRNGFRWERAELYWLERLLRSMRHPRLRPLTVAKTEAEPVLGGGHWAFGGRPVPGAASPDEAVYLPGRNLLLLTLAAVHGARLGIDALALGTLKGNPFPDATPAFLSRAQRALRACFERAPSIEAPFRLLTKGQVVERAGALRWDLTFSCLAPRGRRACGRCNKCEERRRVLGF